MTPKQLIKRLLPGGADPHALRSYSQEGEDMVLRRIFESVSTGFFVDVGAHHPEKFSNTNYFYKLGWRGINIEPNPDAIRLFMKSRTRDINLQCGVSDQPGSLKYYLFDEPALNSFDAALVRQRQDGTPFRLIGEMDIEVRRLDSVLEQSLPDGVSIDFLSIDVEGLDFQVLKSNDWSRFRPRCVLVELLNSTLEDMVGNETCQFMQAKGYSAFGKTYNTWIFKAND
jgi:FkbM family methyltransferase